MKRQSLVLLAVALVAAGAAGCFKDPVSSLRNGPSRFSLDHNAVFILTGDSTTVTAYLMDNGGNQLPVTGVVWTSLDPSIAVVRNDTTLPIPGNAFTRGVIRAIITTGGWTYVTIASRGVTDTIRVVVLPPVLPASQMAYAGGPAPDTVIIPAQVGPPPVPPDTVIYSTSDTLVINGTGFLNFDTSAVNGYITGPSGKQNVFVTAKTPQRVSLVVTGGASGKLILKKLQYATTNPNIGTQPLDSLVLSDSVELARMRYRGGVSQTGDTVSLTATNGIHFLPSTVVKIGGTTGILFDTTGPALVLSPAAASGFVTLDKIGLGTAVLDQIVSTGPWTVTATTFGFPAANVSQVGDTLTITSGGRITLDGQTTVAFGAATPTVLSQGANSISVINGGASYTGPVTVDKALLGIARIASLATAGPYTVNQASFLGTVSVLGDTMTVTAPANVAFDAQTSALFGAGNQAIVLSSNATTLKLLSPAAYTGQVQVTGALIGTVRVPAMITPGSYTIGAAQFPSANVSVGGGLLGDTITVTAPTGWSFSTATPVTRVLAGNMAINTSDTTWTVSASASTVKAFAKRGGGGPVRVTNVVIPGGVVVPYLTTPTNFPIDSVTAAAGFPSAASQGSATTITIPANDTAVVYGAIPGAGANFWTFTTTTTNTLKARLAWFGSGNPYGSGVNTTTYTEDLDILICNASTACDESAADLTGFSGAKTNMPEIATTTAAEPAAQYWIGVLGFNVSYMIVYQITLDLQ